MAIKLEFFDTGTRTFEEFKARKEALARAGVMPNVTPANNGKPTKKDTSGIHYPLEVKGPEEIDSNTEAIYKITKYQKKKKESTPEEAEKRNFKWAFYIDGIEIKNKASNWLRLLSVKRRGETISETDKDFMEITDAQKRTDAIAKKAFLYKKTEIKDGVVTLTVKFSKWLDGHKVHIEAYRNNPELITEKAIVATTAVKAQPEIIKGYWTNDKRENITGKTVGYKDTVYMCLKTLGMGGKTVTTELWEEGVTFMGTTRSNDETICMNENIEWKLEEKDRYSYKKLELPDQDTEEYKEQRNGIWEKDPLDLYFSLPSEKETKGYERKYGDVLKLSIKEKVVDAYFAKAVKQEAIHDGTVQDEAEKPKTHTIKSGEFISTIAPKYGIKPWSRLGDFNDIKSPYNKIFVGQVLKLPDDAVMPQSTGGTSKEPQPKPKEETVYERIDSISLGSEVYIVAETNNMHGKRLTLKAFDKEELMAKNDKTSIKLLDKDGNEVYQLENVKIDDTGKAIAKVKLRPKSDEDYKKLKDKFKDDKKAKLYIGINYTLHHRAMYKEFLDGEEFEVKELKNNSTYDGKYTAKEDEIYINIIAPKKRHLQGPLIVFNDLGEILFKTHSLCRGSNANRLKGGGNGDTPTGRTTTSYSPKRHKGKYSYGNYGLIYLTGDSGEFKKATAKGRAGIAIHCGHTVGYYKKSLEDKGQLMSTYGCVRVYNDEMKKLGELYTKLKNKGKTIYCYIEDYDGDINDVYTHYGMAKDSKDTPQTERSTKQ